jgi:hypothetical protein
MREKRCLFPILFVIVLALSLSQFTMKRVVASSSFSASVDTYVCNKYSGDAWLNAHPWTHPYVIVGTDEPNNWLWRAFIKFDLGSLGIPTGSTIESATLSLSVYESGDSCYFWCERITSDWNQELVHWDNQPSVDISTEYTSWGRQTYDVKLIVDRWVNHGAPSHGLALLPGFPRGSSYYWWFYSSESAYKPTLTVTWSYNALTITTDSTTTQPAALVMELRVTRTTEYRTTTVSSTTIAVTTTNTTVTRTL